MQRTVRKFRFSSRSIAFLERSRPPSSLTDYHSAMPKSRRRKSNPSDHHSVYVVYLRNPLGDGRAGYYVGLTGLSPEQRFENHKNGIKSARIVRRHGERLVPRLYA